MRLRKQWRLILAAFVSITLLVGGASGATAAATTRVCAGTKCVTVATSAVCSPSKASCVNGKWEKVTGYCSPSVGCVTIDGQNLHWVGKHRAPTAAELSAMRKCTVSLGLSIASAYAGPGGWTIAGVAVSLWGCS